MNITPAQSFDFAPGVSLQAIVKDGEPWFLANTACAALELSNVSQALSALDEDERTYITVNDVKRGTPRRAVVSESGLYSLIFRSTTPQAKKFQKWVTSVVLPSLRTGGLYVVGQEKVDLASMTYEQSIVHIAGLQAQVAEAEAARWVKSREEKLARADGFRLLRGKAPRVRA